MANAGILFAALSDPTWRHAFERGLRTAASGRPSVGDIARGLPVSRPAVSQHVKVLKDAGLVSGRAEGTRRVLQLFAQSATQTERNAS
jgi:DNA-binding transcriptional ArsR family regulator